MPRLWTVYLPALWTIWWFDRKWEPEQITILEKINEKFWSPLPLISMMPKWRDFAPLWTLKLRIKDGGARLWIFIEAQISSSILYLYGMLALSFPSSIKYDSLLFLLLQSSLEPLISLYLVGTKLYCLRVPCYYCLHIIFSTNPVRRSEELQGGPIIPNTALESWG